MLLILWMMLMHTAFPHVHHEHEEHTHHGAKASHSHDHSGDHDADDTEQKSLVDLFFQNHTHSNHLPQTITVSHEKSDLIKEDQRKLAEVAVLSFTEVLSPPGLETKSLKTQRGPSLESPFFTCNSLRGPPALG
ncbi:hypothetical protein [Algoriphagus confluentis]|uniref:DUF2796 domain-containing protein n=1 Tax=Algoriphagus confluentis TaxID=1697556 RepID=A0ABQ6PKL8_9BACT|nr:hypothetical protein Aconfl_07200 [Algoriphagus confluentis]